MLVSLYPSQFRLFNRNQIHQEGGNSEPHPGLEKEGRGGVGLRESSFQGLGLSFWAPPLLLSDPQPPIPMLL